MAYRCGGTLSNRIGVCHRHISCSYSSNFIRCKLALLSRDYERCVSLCVLCVYKLAKVYTHHGRLSVSKSCVPTFAIYISRLQNNSIVKLGAGTRDYCIPGGSELGGEVMTHVS